jgi:hypothetical protein
LEGNGSNYLHEGCLNMDNDKVFYGSILAMMALFFGYPVTAFFIFLIAVI